MEIKPRIEQAFRDACESRGTTPPESLEDGLVLLESGLDSLGFAIFVTNLEMELGYDPFTLMEDPVYPRTFGEFFEIYDRYKHLAQS